MTEPPAITRFNPGHAVAVARIHQSGITNGFLSQLSARFLGELYTHISLENNALVLVAVDGKNNTPIGFAAGTINTNSLYRSLIIKHGMWYGLLLIRHAFSLMIFKKILETLTYPIFHGKTGALKGRSADVQAKAELLAIAVDSAFRGKKIGAKLVAGFEDFLMKSHCTSYKVVTFSRDESSNSFYKACGFTLCDQFSHHGNILNTYTKRIPSAP